MQTPTNPDWKFLIGDVIIPLVTFVIGLFAGKSIERRKNIKATAKIKGNNNKVMQNSSIHRK